MAGGMVVSIQGGHGLPMEGPTTWRMIFLAGGLAAHNLCMGG